MSDAIVPVPLTQAAFAKFGAVVSCDRDDRAAASANLGSADRRDFLLDVENRRPAARLNLASFRCRPWAARPLSLSMLEKHPDSTQVFVPMTAGRYLVVVAEGDDAPEVATVRAFVATGGAGVGYAPGVWHHPMIALDEAIDFTCLVWEDGTPRDCIVHPLRAALVIAV